MPFILSLSLVCPHILNEAPLCNPQAGALSQDGSKHMGIVQGGIEGVDTTKGATTKCHPGGKVTAMVQECSGGTSMHAEFRVLGYS